MLTRLKWKISLSILLQNVHKARTVLLLAKVLFLVLSLLKALKPTHASNVVKLKKTKNTCKGYFKGRECSIWKKKKFSFHQQWLGFYFLISKVFSICPMSSFLDVKSGI